MTVEETAETLRVSQDTVFRLVRSGELRPLRIGRRTLFRRADIEALIERKLEPEPAG